MILLAKEGFIGYDKMDTGVDLNYSGGDGEPPVRAVIRLSGSFAQGGLAATPTGIRLKKEIFGGD